MTPFDRRFLNPRPEELIDALVEATRTANHRARLGRLVLAAPRETFGAFVQEAATAPEGTKRWLEARVVNNQIGEDRATLVALAWWTDRLGRRHARVVSRRIEHEKEFHETRFGTLHDERPPLWLIYPERLFLRTVEGRRELLAACGCGACGTLDSLGWMGERCAVCHDRGEEGSASDQPPCPSAATLYGHKNSVKFVAFSSGGETLVSVSHDSNLRFWDATTGLQRVSRQPGLGVLGDSLPVASNGRQVVMRGYGGSGLWDAVTGKNLGVNQVPWDLLRPHRLGLSPDGNVVVEAVAWSEPFEVSLLDVSAGITSPQPIRSENLLATSLAFSPDGQQFALGRPEGLVDLVNERMERRQTLRTGSLSIQTALAFDPRGRRLAFGMGIFTSASAVMDIPDAVYASPWRVGWWDLATGALTTSRQSVTSTNAIAFSPDGAWLASAHDDCSVYFWDLAQRVIKLEWHLGAVNSLAFSPDGRLLATGSADGTAKFWPWRRLLEA